MVGVWRKLHWHWINTIVSLACQTVMHHKRRNSLVTWARFLWHGMVRRLQNKSLNGSYYSCATSVMLALEHVLPNHVSKSFMTGERQLVTSCTSLSLLLRLPLASPTYAALIILCDMVITWSSISAARGLTTTMIIGLSSCKGRL